MKSVSVISAAFLTVVVATAFVLAVPVDDAINTKNDQTVEIRSRRDISGIFDSIANGAGEFAVGMKKVGDSVMAAFNGIFSTSNKNAITDGFSKFGKSLKEGFNGLFGQNGDVTKGFKKVGNKIKEAFKGDGSSSSSTSDSDPSPSKDAPSGEVPAEETT